MADNLRPGAVKFTAPGRTKQEMREECDINRIVQRVKKGGVVGNMNRMTPMYRDCTKVPDFQSAMDTVVGCNRLFDALPATVRDRFGNSVVRFLDFVADPANVEEVKKFKVFRFPEEPVKAVVPPVVPAVVPGVPPVAPPAS